MKVTLAISSPSSAKKSAAPYLALSFLTPNPAVTKSIFLSAECGK